MAAALYDTLILSDVHLGAEVSRARAAARIFCGHTHDAMHLEQDGIHYYNSGGWIDARLTYITVGEDGVQIHEYKESAEDRAEEEPTGLHSEADHDSALFEDTEYEEVGR